MINTDDLISEEPVGVRVLNEPSEKGFAAFLRGPDSIRLACAEEILCFDLGPQEGPLSLCE